MQKEGLANVGSHVFPHRFCCQSRSNYNEIKPLGFTSTCCVKYKILLFKMISAVRARIDNLRFREQREGKKQKLTIDLSDRWIARIFMS